MKKVLAITIAVVMCISIFAFNAYPSNAIAQAAVNENNISVMNANVEPAVQSVNLEGISATDIKQNDVTEYYKNQDSIANLLSTETPAAVGTTWAKTYGGTANEVAYSIQQTSDEGYIVAGGTYSFGVGSPDYSDFLVIKLDSIGVVEWANTYGGSSYDQAYSIQQTSDGGYIVAGYTDSFGAGSYDCLIIKLDSIGVVLWAKTYGGSSYDQVFSIQQTSDGGYIVAGYTFSFGAVLGSSNVGQIASLNAGSINSSTNGVYSDCLVIKLDSIGVVTWAKTYGGTGTDFAYSIQETSDGGYIVAGYTSSFGAVLGSSNVGQIASLNAGSINSSQPVNYSDCLVIKLDSIGVVTWAKTYGGTGTDFAYSIQETSDGGYIVAGYTNSFGAGSYDCLVIKLDSIGVVLWAKTYGEYGDDEGAYSIQQTSDGGYIVAGGTNPFAEPVDSPNVGQIASFWTTSTNSSTVVVYSNFLIIKLDSIGVVSWAKTYGGSSYDITNSIQQTSDGGYIVTGGTNPFGAAVTGSSNVGQIASLNAGSINSSTSVAYSNCLVIKLDSNGNIGGSCDYLQDCDPTVGSPSITGVNQTLATSSPAVGAAADVITNSPDIQSDTICGGSISITATAGSGGSISPSGSVGVNYNSSQTFIITPDFGYVISDVLVDGVSVGSVSIYTFTNVTVNHTITALFIPKPIPTFTVAASVSVYGGYATVTPKEQTVQQGSPATVTINPDAGYHITGLTDNGTTVPMTKLVENANGTYTYTVLAVYEDHNIVVTLEKNEYIIKAKTGEGGTISPLGTVTVKYNETETFTITPDSGYKIDKILVDNKPITLAEQKYKFMNIKSNHTIEVTFARLPVKTSLIIALQINNPEITINGITKTIDEQDSKPIIKNDRTLLPIRILIESLDGNIAWNEKEREVTINLNYHTIILAIDSNTAVVDGIKIQIDPNNSKVTPIIINGRTYLPLRFIVEHLDGVVDWDNDTRTVTVYYWP